MANAQYESGTVRNRAIRYQSVLGTALVLISAHIPSGNVSHVERSQVVKLTSAYGSPRALLSDVAAPHKQTSWPNPAGFRRNGDLGQTGSGLSLFYIDTTHIPHSHAFEAKWSKTVDFDTVSGSPLALLTSTSAPFVQTEWLNPRGAKPIIVDFEGSFLLPLTTHKGTAQYDWPVPRGAKPIVADFEGAFLLPLTTVKGTAQYDWPVPQGAKPVVADFEGSFLLPLTTVKGTAQYDWPVPRGAKPKVADWSDQFKLPLTTVRGVNQYSWPNPAGARRNSDLGQTGSGLALNNPAAVDTTHIPHSHISEAKWSKTVSFDTVSGSPIGLLSPQTYPATFAFDYPNPRGAKSVTVSWSDSFKLPLTTVKGTAQYNWPNPVGSRRDGDLGQVGSGLALNTVTDTLIPFSSVSAAKWNTATRIRSVSGSPIALLTAVVVYPASITFDWPNPTRVIVRRPDFVQRNFSLLQPGPQIPVTGQKTIKWSRSMQTTTYNTSLYSENARLSIRQSDWPNPTLATVRRADFIGPNFLLPREPVHVFVEEEVGRTGLPVLDVTALLWNQPIPKKLKKKLELVDDKREVLRQIEEDLERQARDLEQQIERTERKEVEAFRGNLDRLELSSAAQQALIERHEYLRAQMIALEEHLRLVQAYLAEIDDEEAFFFIMMSMQ
jgi:hypothetical protein